VAAAPWKRAVFTTFALSLSFFEAVLLDALLRGGGREALILADPEGICAGLSEQGARRAGRDYEIEPVACSTGVFHPKLSVLIGDTDGHTVLDDLVDRLIRECRPEVTPKHIVDVALALEIAALNMTAKPSVGDHSEHPHLANPVRYDCGFAPHRTFGRRIRAGPYLSQQL